MKWMETRIIFSAPETGLAVELISNCLQEVSLRGVVIETPEPEPVEGWADELPKSPKQNAVIGYFPKDRYLGRRLDRLKSDLTKLEAEHRIRCKILFKETAEEDWAESWKRYFKPQKISDILVVKPTWQPYTARSGEIILEIDPGMAFGTGTHPTTGLCLELVETYLKPGDTFLDVGTGSGILMAAAAKLGASRMLGIDSDPVAVEVARKNLRLNKIPEEQFSLRTAHLMEGVKKPHRMVVANILTPVILDLLDHLPGVLADDGVFILSGITEENTETVVEKIRASLFRVLEIRSREKWVAIAGSCPS